MIGMPMNRFHGPAAAAALILGLAACGGASTTSSQAAPHSSAPSATSPSSAPAQPAGTQVIEYNPWTAAGTLASGISATATQSGSCFSMSSATTAGGAYRCTVGNDLFDPCFSDASSGAGEVACPSRDNPDSLTVIKLTSPLPASQTSAPASPLPWLLVLANGQHCNTNTGTVGTLGGKNEYFICTDGGAYGTPDESSSTWTITYAPSGVPASAMTQQDVTTAYE